MSLSTPTLLTGAHQVDAFDCGVASLDLWLKRRALANQVAGASRTYVACAGDTVAGFYALASGSVSPAVATGRFRRNMPDPIPVVVLGRLAIDLRHQRSGLGRALLRDAGMRVARAADVIGVRGILVHAISDAAQAFYVSIGFDPSPVDPLTLMISLADLRAALEP